MPRRALYKANGNLLVCESILLAYYTTALDKWEEMCHFEAASIGRCELYYIADRGNQKPRSSTLRSGAKVTADFIFSFCSLLRHREGK